MQNAKLLVATLIITLLFVFGFSWVAQNWLEPAATTPTADVTATSEELLTADPHVLGADESAPYTIVEFSDFRCPACQAVSGALRGLVNQYPGQVRLVYRHFPLTNIHPNAYRLAEISEAANAQGKFWETHDFLFDHQTELSELNDQESLDFVVDHSNEIGLDGEQLRQAIEAGQYADQVEEDLRRAEQLRLNFTPSLFLNGKLMPIDQIQLEISSAQTEAETP